MRDRCSTHDRSWRTADRGPPGPTGGVAPSDAQERRLIYTVEQISPRRELKRNGDLVCYDVPIARVGDMLYGVGEVPVMPNPTSPSVYVQRTAEELFKPEAIASFYGAAVVDGHPDFTRYPRGVTPDNYKELAGGFAINPRRGKDGDDDVLLVDLIITRRDLIEAIESGKREISAGYDASYETIRPGLGRQYDIFANHIALVSKGRCGPRCAIGDHATIDDTDSLQEAHMPGATQGAPQPRRRFDAATLDAIEGMVQEGRRSLALVDDGGESSAVHVHIHGGSVATQDKKTGDDDGDGKGKEKDGDEEGYAQLKKTVDALADSVGQIGAAVKAMSSDRSRTKDAEGDEKDGDGKEKKTGDDAGDGDEKDKNDKSMTGDSAALATSWQTLAANAEVLMPGFKMPTFDSAQTRKLTVDSMCTTRRAVLTQLVATQDGATLIAGLADEPLDKLDCSALAVTFNAAAKMKAASNNQAATRDAQNAPGAAALGARAGAVPVPSISAINDQNKSFWARSAKKA